jgi:ubiquinone/menaquinone biosynthesis C-methylase UbiE
MKNKNLDKIINTRFGSNLVYQEHLARYKFIKRSVQGKSILEVGCGIGDGTFELAKCAERVIAVELDRKRLKLAFDFFSHPHINYIIMDGCRLGFKDESFDIVISFEVIEHLEDQERYLSEIRRVLKNGGMAIISTPNKDIIRVEGIPNNPEHVKELNKNEFMYLLEKFFQKVELYAQRKGRKIIGITGIIHHILRFLDIFKLRKLFPQRLKNAVSERISTATGAKRDEDILSYDFVITKRGIRFGRNLIGICKKL